MTENSTELTPAEAQEAEAEDGYSVATLAGADLRVKAITHWRPSHLRALRTADYDTWAAGVLHEDDVEEFINVDATLGEINDFVSAAMESAGEAPKAPSARSRSSRSTRKR